MGTVSDVNNTNLSGLMGVQKLENPRFDRVVDLPQMPIGQDDAPSILALRHDNGLVFGTRLYSSITCRYGLRRNASHFAHSNKTAFLSTLSGPLKNSASYSIV